MGGYLTYRLGLLMPDAFARASVFVGPPIFYHWSYPLPPDSPEEWIVRGNTRPPPFASAGRGRRG